MSNQRNSLNVMIDSTHEIERFLNEHKYDIVMLKSKQLIDYMARKLANIYQINVSDSEIIDALYAERVLSKESLENYQRIRLLGISALQSNDTGEYNAKTSFTILKQEIEQFAKITEQIDSEKKPTLNEDESETTIDTTEHEDGGIMEEKKPMKRYREDEGVELKNSAGIAAKIHRARSKSRPKRTRNNLIRLGLTLAPFIFGILLILLVFFASKALFGKKQAKETTVPTTVAASETEATLIEETTTAPTITRYVTTSALNVRSAPSTDGEKITTLQSGTTVDFVGDYDNVWAIINYNGAQAYVSKQYLKLQE